MKDEFPDSDCQPVPCSLNQWNNIWNAKIYSLKRTVVSICSSTRWGWGKLLNHTWLPVEKFDHWYLEICLKSSWLRPICWQITRAKVAMFSLDRVAIWNATRSEICSRTDFADLASGLAKDPDKFWSSSWISLFPFFYLLLFSVKYTKIYNFLVSHLFRSKDHQTGTVVSVA